MKEMRVNNLKNIKLDVEHLIIEYTDITNLDVSKLYNLKTLKIYYCKGNLTLTNSTLEYFVCYLSNIKILKIKCNKIISISSTDSQIEELELIVDNLNFLYLNNNKLRKLKLHCPKLKTLNMNDNPLIYLDVINCPNLQVLSILNTKIKTSNNIKLNTYIYRILVSYPIIMWEHENHFIHKDVLPSFKFITYNKLSNEFFKD